MGVYQGIVVEVYEPKYWQPGNKSNYEVRVFKDDESTHGRYEFTGDRADSVRDDYVGKYVGKFGMNPVRYLSPK